MSREERAFEKLPDFSSLRGLLLNSVCLIDRQVNLGRNRMPTNLYVRVYVMVIRFKLIIHYWGYLMGINIGIKGKPGNVKW